MMRNTLLFVAAATLGFAAGLVSHPKGSAAPDGAESTSLVRVIDGDTIIVDPVELPPSKWRLRLASIDTPELGDPPEQGAEEAAAALREMLDGVDIRLQHAEEPFSLGVYGRLVVYVWFRKNNGEWKMANAELVRKGWSRHWTRYGRGKHADVLDELEDEARDARRGAWGLEDRPWPIWPEDVNNVRMDWLKEIDGVGAVTARRVVEYRERSGTIENLDELRDAGIGRSMVDRLSEYLTTE